MLGTCFPEEIRHLPFRLCDYNISSSTCCVPGARLPCFLPGRHDLSDASAWGAGNGAESGNVAISHGNGWWRTGVTVRVFGETEGIWWLFVWWQLLNQAPSSHSRKSLLKWWFSSVLRTHAQLWSGQIQLKGLHLTKNNSKLGGLRRVENALIEVKYTLCTWSRASILVLLL